MNKEPKVNLELTVKTALDILQILNISTNDYSEKYAPERIIRIRKAISNIETELKKHTL